MATATKSKSATKPAPLPVTFDEIAAKRMAERLEKYRTFVSRQAAGETLGVADMETVADLLDQIGLPAYAFSRDIEATERHHHATAKYQAAVEAAPEHKANAKRLEAEVEKAKRQLAALVEEHRLALAKSNKPGAYGQTLALLANDHPHLFAPLTDATRLRVEELDRRKRSTIGGVA